MIKGWLRIKTKVDNSGVDKQIEDLENKLNDLKATLKIADEDKTVFSKSQVLGMEVEVEKLTNKIKKLKKQQEEAITSDWDKVKGSIDSVNKGISTTIKKVGKWALAIFSVRSAYSAIRNVMSTLSQYDKQLATDLEYMKFALANALKPLIEGIVNLMYKLLGLINAISTSMFGINLFANSNVKAFQKMSGSAKEIKKSLAGFDEMNVLGDSKGGSAGGVTAPSMDLSKVLPEQELISNYWKKIFDFWEEDWENWFVNTGGNWDVFIEGIGTTLKGFYDVFKGVFELIGGVVTIFVGVFTGDLDLIKKGWDMTIGGLKDIVIGVLEFVGGLFLTFLGTIKGIILSIWDFIKSIFSKIGKFIKDTFTDAWEGIKKVFSNVGNFFTNIFETIKSIFKKIGTTIGDVVGGAFKTAINGALSLVEGILNAPIRAINGLLDVINKVPGVEINRINTISLPRLAGGGIVNNPGHGVMMGNYIAGESGREGVLPLSNPATMEALGKEIGKWIRVNNVSNTYLDGRLIKREQDRVAEEFNFATNGGSL